MSVDLTVVWHGKKPGNTLPTTNKPAEPVRRFHTFNTAEPEQEIVTPQQLLISAVKVMLCPKGLRNVPPVLRIVVNVGCKSSSTHFHLSLRARNTSWIYQAHWIVWTYAARYVVKFTDQSVSELATSGKTIYVMRTWLLSQIKHDIKTKRLSLLSQTILR